MAIDGIAGAILLLARWAIRWIGVVRLARGATPLRTGEPIAALRRLERGSRRRPLPVLATAETIELGVFGVIRPVLLWPVPILGNEPRRYAEGLVRICEYYVETPAACVAGVTGSDSALSISISPRGRRSRSSTTQTANRAS